MTAVSHQALFLLRRTVVVRTRQICSLLPWWIICVRCTFKTRQRKKNYFRVCFCSYNNNNNNDNHNNNNCDNVCVGTAVRVHSPCPRLYIAVVFMINVQLPMVGFEPWTSHTAVRHVTTGPLRLCCGIVRVWCSSCSSLLTILFSVNTLALLQWLRVTYHGLASVLTTYSKLMPSIMGWTLYHSSFMSFLLWRELIGWSHHDYACLMTMHVLSCHMLLTLTYRQSINSYSLCLTDLLFQS